MIKHENVKIIVERLEKIRHDIVQTPCPNYDGCTGCTLKEKNTEACILLKLKDDVERAIYTADKML